MSRFNFTDDQLDVLQDGINEELNERAAARGCPVCNGTGAICPVCGDEEVDWRGEPINN